MRQQLVFFDVLLGVTKKYVAEVLRLPSERPAQPHVVGIASDAGGYALATGCDVDLKSDLAVSMRKSVTVPFAVSSSVDVSTASFVEKFERRKKRFFAEICVDYGEG